MRRVDRLDFRLPVVTYTSKFRVLRRPVESALDASFAQFVHHRQPELGAFVVGDPEPEDLALPVTGDAQGDKNGGTLLAKSEPAGYGALKGRLW